jgi:hypothetical protein
VHGVSLADRDHFLGRRDHLVHILVLHPEEYDEETMKLKIEVDIPENVLNHAMDTALTALEAWAAPHDPEDWIIRNPVSGEVDSIRVKDREDEMSYCVRQGTIRLGMQRILDRDPEEFGDYSSLAERIQEAVLDDDTKMLDKDDVNSIVQFGLFGEEIH